MLKCMAERRKERIAVARACALEAARHARFDSAWPGRETIPFARALSGAPASLYPARQFPGGGSSRGRRRTAPVGERKKRGSRAGRGQMQTRGERMALCRAVREATLNGILAADKQKEDYWGQMLLEVAEQTPKNLSANHMAEWWVQRFSSAVMVEFTCNISPCCQRFVPFYHGASTKATVSTNEDGMFSSARSLFSAAAMYGAEQAEAVKDAKSKRNGRAVPVGRSCFVLQNCETSWKELWGLAKYSGATANPGLERSFQEGLLSEEDSDLTEGSEKGDTMDGAASLGAEDPRARPVSGPAQMTRPALGLKALKRRLADNTAVTTARTTRAMTAS